MSWDHSQFAALRLSTFPIGDGHLAPLHKNWGLRFLGLQFCHKFLRAVLIGPDIGIRHERV